MSPTLRVYGMSDLAHSHPAAAPLYAAQIGKYLVELDSPAVFLGGEFVGHGEYTRRIHKAVVDDFGNLRRVPS